MKCETTKYLTDNTPPTVNNYLYYLKYDKGASQNTIEAYRGDLCLFFKYMKRLKTDILRKMDIEKIDASDIDNEFISSIKLYDVYGFINYITIIRHNGFRARARKISAIKSFYKYFCSLYGSICENPAQGLETPRISNKKTEYLTLDESSEVLNSIDGLYRERDYSIIMLFLNYGLSVSELIGLNIDNLKENMLAVTGAEEKICLNDACLKVLQDYLVKRLSDNSEALFLSERKNRISKRTVQYIIKKYLEKANIDSSKKARHTEAALINKYGSISATEKVLK